MMIMRPWAIRNSMSSQLILILPPANSCDHDSDPTVRIWARDKLSGFSILVDKRKLDTPISVMRTL